MKYLLLLIFILGASLLSAQEVDTARFLTLKEWQEQRVKEAQAILTKTQIARAESISKDDKKVTPNDVQQAKINIDIARELTPHDYFVLYVIPRSKDDRNALLMAVQTLSKLELTEILTSYQTTLEEKKRVLNGPEKSPASEESPSDPGFALWDIFGSSKKPKN